MALKSLEIVKALTAVCARVRVPLALHTLVDFSLVGDINICIPGRYPAVYSMERRLFRQQLWSTYYVRNCGKLLDFRFTQPLPTAFVELEVEKQLQE